MDDAVFILFVSLFFPYNRTVQNLFSLVPEDMEQNKMPDKTKKVSEITANLVLFLLLWSEYL